MKNKKQISIILLMLTLISCLYISKPSIEIQSAAATIEPAATSKSTSSAPAPNFTINSEGAILIDSKTGKILYGKNENEKLYPASTTKILTAIIAIENCQLTDKITASYDAVMSLPSGYSNAAIQLSGNSTPPPPARCASQRMIPSFIKTFFLSPFCGYFKRAMERRAA